jgi:hypothetical protein
MRAIISNPVELRRVGFESLVNALGWVNAVLVTLNGPLDVRDQGRPAKEHCVFAGGPLRLWPGQLCRRRGAIAREPRPECFQPLTNHVEPQRDLGEYDLVSADNGLRGAGRSAE